MVAAEGLKNWFFEENRFSTLNLNSWKIGVKLHINRLSVWKMWYPRHETNAPYQSCEPKFPLWKTMALFLAICFCRMPALNGSLKSEFRLRMCVARPIMSLPVTNYRHFPPPLKLWLKTERWALPWTERPKGLPLKRRHIWPCHQCRKWARAFSSYEQNTSKSDNNLGGVF